MKWFQRFSSTLPQPQLFLLGRIAFHKVVHVHTSTYYLIRLTSLIVLCFKMEFKMELTDFALWSFGPPQFWGAETWKCDDYMNIDEHCSIFIVCFSIHSRLCFLSGVSYKYLFKIINYRLQMMYCETHASGIAIAFIVSMHFFLPVYFVAPLGAKFSIVHSGNTLVWVFNRDNIFHFATTQADDRQKHWPVLLHYYSFLGQKIVI